MSNKPGLKNIKPKKEVKTYVLTSDITDVMPGVINLSFPPESEVAIVGIQFEHTRSGRRLIHCAVATTKTREEVDEYTHQFTYEPYEIDVVEKPIIILPGDPRYVKPN